MAAEVKILTDAEKKNRTSHSKCDVFQGCPLRGYFQYIARVPPEDKFKNYAFTGSYVHDCIEQWFLTYMEGTYNLNELVYPGEHFTTTMQSIYARDCDTIKEDADEDAILLCLDNFIQFMALRYDNLKAKGLIDRFLPIAIEKEYAAIINGVPFHGYIDAMFYDTQLWMCDWKTNKDGQVTKKYVIQGIRYALLVDASKEFSDPVNDFYVINLRNRIDLTKAHVIITDADKKAQEAELAEIWKIITGSEFPKPKTKKDCFFCDYKLRCLAYSKQGVTLSEHGIPIVPVAEKTVVDVIEEADVLAGISESVFDESVFEEYTQQVEVKTTTIVEEVTVVSVASEQKRIIKDCIDDWI